MTGYRDTSNYDPYASPRYGKPLRPYNMVQWTGVGFAVVGIAIELAYLAGRLGWIRDFKDGVMLGNMLVLLSIPLINSRREELPGLAPDIAAARKRWLLIIVLVCAVILGAAAAIEFARS